MIRRGFRLLIATLALSGLLAIAPGVSAPAHAQTTIDAPLEDPAMERRAKALFKLLRCLVCQNQSIDDSNADLARDLRVLVRQRLKDGDSDDQAVAYIVDRYGDWVLLDPPFKAGTLVLWIGPLVIFLLGAGGVVRYMRRRNAEPPAPAAPLSDDEQEQMAALMDSDDNKDGPA